MSKDLEFLIELVKGASNLITDEFEVKVKDDKGDLVTNFDYEIEKYMIEKIKLNYPDFSIISEEYNSNKSLTDNCFTIDPIDGTINFAHNIPLWGIQVACIRNKKTCAAVIYLPRLNELYYADENGAFLNGASISVNNCEVNKGLYSIEGPGKMLGSLKMQKISRHCRDFYCAAVNFAYVACGRLSGTNFVWDTLWDYIPGQYIVEQAGGITYNNIKMHIAANNEVFLKTLKEHSSVNNDEEVIITKK
ncbi:MAG: inositol monophosphatase [Erysipelotrichales bacterium]|nr:inositol monophosphatase [Erysipelotrichales bacterium]